MLDKTRFLFSLPTPTYRPLKDATDDELTIPQHVKPGKIAQIATKSQIERSRLNAPPTRLILHVEQAAPDVFLADPTFPTVKIRDE